jgi:hypothetical protein
MTNKQHNDNVFLKEEARLLLNQQVVVTSHHSRHTGRTGIVQGVMADGRTLDIEFPILRGDRDSERAFLDVTLVSEIQEPVAHAKGEPNLGPDGNSVLPRNRI